MKAFHSGETSPYAPLFKGDGVCNPPSEGGQGDVALAENNAPWRKAKET